MKKLLAILLSMAIFMVSMIGCESEVLSATDKKLQTNASKATSASAKVIANQPAPTDLDYSLERYNLIRRAYWVNGQREKAISLPCSVNKPLGYIVLFSANGSVIGNFVVDGKVSSLSSYLFPAYVDYTSDGLSAATEFNSSVRTDGSVFSVEIPGVDGAYGSNVKGIFFFTPNGKYMEWTGDFLYSDIPFDTQSMLKEKNK